MSSQRSHLDAVRAHRAVLRVFISRDLKVRYEGAALGYLWTLFEPLLMIGVYYVVFDRIARFGIDDYILFLTLGMLPWIWFSGSVVAGTRSIINRAGILGKVYVPRELAPLSVVGAKAVEYAASLPVLVIVASLSGRAPGWQVVLIPVGWLLQGALLIGVTMLLASANVLYRDVERVTGVILRFLFYATPILYPVNEALDRLPAALSWFYLANPMTGIMEMYRYGFYPEFFPGWGTVVVATIGSLVVLVAGWAAFLRLEPLVLKEL